MGEILFKISPNYDSVKQVNPALNDFIDIYEDRVKGWLIDSAKILNKYEHAGFSVLHIIFAYFEAHASVYHGINTIGQAGTYFKQAFQAIFPDIGAHPL